MISIVDLETLLLENFTNSSQNHWVSIATQAKELLEACIGAGDSQLADKAWFLDKVASTRSAYIRCFEQLRQKQYFDAWCELERIEIDLEWLTINQFFDPERFGVTAFTKAIAEWQALFPYKLFFSPGFLHKRTECSICHQVNNPWNDCGHEPKRVYGGIECVRIVTEVEAVEISLVRDPVQKYSVVREHLDADGNSVDSHDYSLVRFVVERLSSPFDGWTMRWITAYHDHALFPELNDESVCPCDSGLTYGKCCRALQGVRMPHAQVVFDKQPVGNLPMAVLKKPD